LAALLLAAPPLGCDERAVAEPTRSTAAPEASVAESDAATTSALGCKLAPELAVVTDTGTAGRSAPAVAPGAVIFTRKTDDREISLFQRIGTDGSPRGEPAPIDAHYVSPRALTRYRDGYLAVGEGRGGAALLELGADGSAKRRLLLERSEWASFAALATAGDRALVAWRDRTSRSVRACWVDLTGWRAEEPSALGSDGSWSQAPRIAAGARGFALAWAEAPRGRPIQARRTPWIAAGASLAPSAAAPIGEPPSVPVGFADVGVGSRLIYAHGTATRTLLLQGAGGADRRLLQLDEPIPYVAVARLSSASMLLYVEHGDVKLLRLSQPQGEPGGAPHALSADGRARNPAAAGNGERLWLAWDHVEPNGASSVRVRTATCR